MCHRRVVGCEFGRAVGAHTDRDGVVPVDVWRHPVGPREFSGSERHILSAIEMNVLARSGVDLHAEGDRGAPVFVGQGDTELGSCECESVVLNGDKVVRQRDRCDVRCGFVRADQRYPVARAPGFTPRHGRHPTRGSDAARLEPTTPRRAVRAPLQSRRSSRDLARTVRVQAQRRRSETRVQCRR